MYMSKQLQEPYAELQQPTEFFSLRQRKKGSVYSSLLREASELLGTEEQIVGTPSLSDSQRNSSECPE